MDEVPAKNAPSFGGWFLAAGAAVVAFGVAMVVFDFRVPQAALVAVLLFVIVGLILGRPDRPIPAGPDLADVASRPAAPATVAASPAAPPAVAPLVAPVVTAAPVAATKPEGLAAPRGGKADDLKIIKGIGPALEKLCHSLGYYHFDQLAKWTAEEIAWVDGNLEGFKGRVTRDEWVAQARILAAGGSIA